MPPVQPHGGIRAFDRLLVEYQDDDYIHERLVLTLPTAGAICGVTPHYDVYVEDLDDWKSCWRPGPRGDVPPRWRQSGKFIRFNNEGLADRLPGLETAARREAPSTVDVAYFGGAPPPGTGVAVVQVAPQRPDERGTVWIAMEDRCGYTSGQVVAVDPNELVRLGDRALWPTNLGVLTLAVDGACQAPVPETPWPLDDLLALPWRDVPLATFASAVEQGSQLRERIKERRKAREEREGTDDGAGADHSGPKRRRRRGVQQPKADPARY